MKVKTFFLSIVDEIGRNRVVRNLSSSMALVVGEIKLNTLAWQFTSISSLKIFKRR